MENPARRVFCQPLFIIKTYHGHDGGSRDHEPELLHDGLLDVLSFVHGFELWLVVLLNELGVDRGHRHEDVDVVVGGRLVAVDQDLPALLGVELGHHDDLGAHRQGAEQAVQHPVGSVQRENV